MDKWSFLGFLEALKPFCILSGRGSIEDRESLWRKKYTGYLKSIIAEAKQGPQDDLNVERQRIAAYLLKLTPLIPFCFPKKRVDTTAFWTNLDLETDLEEKQNIVKRKSQIEGLELLDTARSQQNGVLRSQLSSKEQALELGTEKQIDQIKLRRRFVGSSMSKCQLGCRRPLWWRIVDVSEPNLVPDILLEEEFLELNGIFSSALDLGCPKNNWTVLEPAAQRCLQSLSELDSNQLREVAEVVRPEGTIGAIKRLRKISEGIKESTFEPGLFDDEPMDKAPCTCLVKETDYMDPDVQYIFDLLRFTCEMLAKGIPQRKNSERDIDIFIKTHIFSCFDGVLDRHFGDMVSRASRKRRIEAIDVRRDITWIGYLRNMTWPKIRRGVGNFHFVSAQVRKLKMIGKFSQIPLRSKRPLGICTATLLELSQPQEVERFRNQSCMLVLNFSRLDSCRRGSSSMSFSLSTWGPDSIHQLGSQSLISRRLMMRLGALSKLLGLCCKQR
ncbi:hypothetical protein BC938DRAFT_481434 [Jimgerdemannia flammicorona]|uniref:Uncharacterized protein n=1 Tax=Jimgerdemannia flammicorona TaxID=994334 RepID=A0A433QGU4_9FUNG|nr:hypothetical protein BC938DRAFT_481434 [Jimgerdemannia flammicorona]